ncbi:MAG: multidrug efflux MFS transporter outer membrane subunit VceC [Chlamydiales bacterium]
MGLPKDHAEVFYSPPPLDSFIKEGLSTGTIQSGCFPIEQWWVLFEDPQLDEYILHALEKNPTFREAQYRIAQAREQAKIQRSALFPYVWFHSEVDAQYLGRNDFFRAYDPNVIPERVPEYKIDLDFSYEFDFWGKWRNLYRASLGYAKAEQAECKQVQLMLGIEIAATYFLLQKNREEIALYQELESAAFSLNSLNIKRRENALAGALEEIPSEELLFSTKQLLLLVEEQFQLNQHLLAFLIGEGPQYPIALSERNKTRTIVSVPQSLECDLISRRPDIMAQLWRVSALAHQVGAAKADFYPNINLAGLIGYDSVFFDQIFTPSSYTANIIPALHLPIFTAGRIKAHLKEKQAMYHEAVSHYNSLILQAAKEVTDALTHLQISLRNLDVQEQKIVQQEKRVALETKRFENAVSSEIDRLEAIMSLIRQRILALEIEYQSLLSTLKVIKSLGGGYQPAPCL